MRLCFYQNFEFWALILGSGHFLTLALVLSLKFLLTSLLISNMSGNSRRHTVMVNIHDIRERVSASQSVSRLSVVLWLFVCIIHVRYILYIAVHTCMRTIPFV